MKLLLTLALSVSLLLFSCSSEKVKPVNSDLFTSELFQGFYLVDDVFFPQDTLIMHRVQLSDSTTKEKLLLQFKNDSLYLSNYNFGGWYGKWFCGFRNAEAKFTKEKLAIDALINTNYSRTCLNEDVWHKIEYQLIDSTDLTFTLIKTLDSTNCVRIPYRNVMTHLGRGGRDFTDEGGEEIRSDIQLR